MHRIRVVCLCVVGLLAGCATHRTTCDDVFLSAPFMREQRPPPSEKMQEIARESFIYAQMAYNAYQRPNSFALHDSIDQLPPETRGYGFQATVFEVRSGADLREIVIAYRGTDGLTNVRDWLFGNLGRTQYRLARDLYREVRERYPEGTRIVTTGHSLGGGLAIHISTNEPDVPAYVFNYSYKRHWEGRRYAHTRRVGIVESGDILGIVRGIWPNTDILHNRGFYCSRAGNNHSMEVLARCVTHTAAVADERAVDSLTRNRIPRCELSPGALTHKVDRARAVRRPQGAVAL